MLSVRRSKIIDVLTSSLLPINRFRTPNVIQNPIILYTNTNQQRSYSAENIGPGRAFIQAFNESIKKQVQVNKHLNENVKLLSAEANRISETDSIKKARELALQSSSKTSSAIKATSQKVANIVANSVTDTVHKVADTSVGKAAVSTVKTTAHVMGNVAEAAVRPITENKNYQQASEELNRAIQAASIRYGGVTSKQYRDLIRKQRLLDHEIKCSKMKENPDATQVVLNRHSSSKWIQSWDEFKALNPVIRTMFHLSSKLSKSNNIFVSWGRYLVGSIQDRLGGVFEETEVAKAMSLFQQLDPTFTQESFMREAREFILPELLESWLQGDAIALREWCSEASVRVMTAQHNDLVQKQNMVSDSKLIELKQVDFAGAKILDNNVPVIMVSFTTQEIILYRDRISKAIVLGKEDIIMRCSYVIVFTVDDTLTSHPITRGWKVVDQAKHATGSMV